MKSDKKSIEDQTNLLKESRLEFLKLHKILVDSERANFERQNGKISSGQFLNLLVNDSTFEWLRKFSVLIVEIDEMLDLDDGFSQEMIGKHFAQMRKILDVDTDDKGFNERYENYLNSNSEVSEKNERLKELLRAE